MANKRNPVGWFEIYVQDLAKARAFYEGVFEEKLTELGGSGLDLKMLTFPMDMDKPGAAGALVKMEGKDSGIGGTIIYFSCRDCAVEEARVTEFGGKVHRPKMSIGDYGFITLALDPDGNIFGLHSME